MYSSASLARLLPLLAQVLLKYLEFGGGKKKTSLKMFFSGPTERTQASACS